LLNPPTSGDVFFSEISHQTPTLVTEIRVGASRAIGHEPEAAGAPIPRTDTLACTLVFVGVIWRVATTVALDELSLELREKEF
jgi:hypothetical protein